MLVTSYNRLSSSFQSKLNRIQHLKLVDGLLHLIYPSNCLICEGELVRTENNVCSFCLSELSYTYYETFKEPTELDQLFWGRIELEFTYAMLNYSKSNTSSSLLKALKYKQRKDVGVGFGQLIGERINSIEKFKTVDALVPVPIHPKKEFIRGYNQSETIARGISQITNVPVKDLFIRNENSSSQTRLGRFGRWDNVSNKFSVRQVPSSIKHIAIVDDVITTGATLESLLKEMHAKHPKIKLSVISLAVTK